MIEQGNPQEELSDLELYQLLGRLTVITGNKPSDLVQKYIESDPEKQEAFLQGAEEAQRLKEEKTQTSR
jgi:hypothetical protein